MAGTGVHLTVCGEMGGRPLEALALLGIGYRRLSITPAAVAAVKAAVRSVDLAALSAFVTARVDDGSPDLRDQLTAWLAEHADPAPPTPGPSIDSPTDMASHSGPSRVSG